MHITVTDVLVCPHCGPEYGLVLLADDVSERRVRLGTLGCPNCHRHYPIQNGIVTFVDDTEQRAASPDLAEQGAGGGLTQALEWAALLGVEGPGRVLMAGPAVRHAPDLADLLPDVEILALLDVGTPDVAFEQTRNGATTRVSSIRALSGFPVRPGGLAAAGLSGSAANDLLERATSAVRMGGRVVLDPAPGRARDRLVESGATVLVHEGDTIVAVRS